MHKTNAIFTIMIAFVTGNLFSQTQFFKSDISFSKRNFENFYASLTTDGTSIFFIANNYTMYNFDQTGNEIWSSQINWKTNSTPYFIGDMVLTGYYDDNKSYTTAALLNKADGKLIRTLPFQPVQTQPYYNNGILYCTAIYEAGQILAYDVAKDTLVWDRFISHGVSNQPLYLKDRIIANAEDTNWFEMSYDNKLLGNCDNPAGFVDDITCVKNYAFLAHDGTEIKQEFIDKHFGYTENLIKYFSDDNTFIMNDQKLVILGKKGKVKYTIDVTAQTDEDPIGIYYNVLKADKNTVWYFSNQILYEYDLNKGKAKNKYNLDAWLPDKVLLDGKNIWLISANDGQLYGLEIK